MTKYVYAIWRRKTASAQIKLFNWTWESKINWKELGKYITRQDLFDAIFQPLKVCWLKDKVFFECEVSGSGPSAQAQAIGHALSRALVKDNEDLRKALRMDGLLTRDSRKVERKKPGKKKARKSPSWSKR